MTMAHGSGGPFAYRYRALSANGFAKMGLPLAVLLT